MNNRLYIIILFLGVLFLAKGQGNPMPINVSKSISVVSGKTYQGNIDISNPTNQTLSLKVFDENNSLVSQEMVASGTNGTTPFSFTASNTAQYQLWIGFDQGFNNASFSIDNYSLSYSETTMEQVCSTDDSYRYGFNGMEKDDEVKGGGNSYDFGARIYDSRLGRWLSIDPDFGLFANVSSYSTQLNNPIYYVDPTGRVVVPVGEKAQALWDKYYGASDCETQARLDKLIASDIVYEINYAEVDPNSHDYGGHTQLKYLDDGDGNIVISMEINPSITASEADQENHALQVLADEATHSYQFETGDIGYEAVTNDGGKTYSSNVVGFDAQDEIASKEAAKTAVETHSLTPISSNNAYIDAIGNGKTGEEFLKEYKRADGASYSDIFTEEKQWSPLKPDEKEMKASYKAFVSDGYVYRKDGETIKKSRGNATKSEIK